MEQYDLGDAPQPPPASDATTSDWAGVVSLSSDLPAPIPNPPRPGGIPGAASLGPSPPARPQPTPGESAAYRDRSRRRQLRISLVLFAATCASTFLMGAINWDPAHLLDLSDLQKTIGENWQRGLIYMVALVSILLAHEMGHFLQAVRYRVPASLPIFIPFPILFGTMGAVIFMDSPRATRKQLFDIGISGPLAGLALALPIAWLGIVWAQPMPVGDSNPMNDPLIFRLIAGYLHPEFQGALLDKHNPLLMAGWFGMLLTGLNMLPMSGELDGGHVIYGLFGQRSHTLARAFLITSIAYIVLAEQYNWAVMLVLVICLGVDHPPTQEENEPLDPVRHTIGLASLIIPVLCFIPNLMM